MVGSTSLKTDVEDGIIGGTHNSVLVYTSFAYDFPDSELVYILSEKQERGHNAMLPQIIAVFFLLEVPCCFASTEL